MELENLLHLPRITNHHHPTNNRRSSKLNNGRRHVNKFKLPGTPLELECEACQPKQPFLDYPICSPKR
jgi:hypothetical protein